MEKKMSRKNEVNFRPIIGIDLGTTNSAVARIHQGKPEILPDKDGNPLVPSVVLIDPSEKVIVGRDARSALIAMPERTKASIKRDMGKDVLITLAGKDYPPVEISAFILKQIKSSVDEAYGEGEKEAVITVPAYFTDEQRQATKKAGELAGFVVERIINEPTAAALAFGFEHLDQNRHVLVYDLGGGTFDVSIVEIMDDIIEVKASAGNSSLGGDDFDWLLVDWLAEIMIAEHNADPRKDIRGKALLKEEAEKIKQQLSTEDEVELSLAVVMMVGDKPLGLHKTITREIFIELIDPLLQQTMEKVTEVLKEANLPSNEVDDILLVGGSTRIPRVHERITDFFGKPPRTDINPDEAVALGAGVQAGLKSGALSDSGLIVTDVAPFSMGIAVLKETGPRKARPGAFQAIIPKNTTIPVTRTERFYTSSHGQTSVQIEIYQGEQEWVKDNHFLNEFILDGLPSSPAGTEAVDVTFRYNLNGILEVTAKSVSTSESMSIRLQDAIDRSSNDAFQESLENINAANNGIDDDMPDEFEQQNIFDLLEVDEEEVSTTEDILKEAKQWHKRCRSALKDASPGERKQLREVINQLKDAIDTEDVDAMEDAMDAATDIFIDLEL